MNPAQHEGALHTTRQRIISNKTLMQSADRTGLPQYIQGKPFSYKHWQPPNFTTSPLPGSNATEHGTVGDEKSVASGRVRIDDSATCINCESDVNPPSTSATKKKSRDDSATQWLGDKVAISCPLQETHLFPSRRLLMWWKPLLVQRIFAADRKMLCRSPKYCRFRFPTSSNGTTSVGKRRCPLSTPLHRFVQVQ